MGDITTGLRTGLRVTSEIKYNINRNYVEIINIAQSQ